MSDPSYVPTQSPSREQHASGPAGDIDTSLDEAIARQLALEDEEERRRGRRQPAGQSWPRRGAGVPVGAEESFAYDQQRQDRTAGGDIPYEVRTSNRQQVTLAIPNNVSNTDLNLVLTSNSNREVTSLEASEEISRNSKKLLTRSPKVSFPIPHTLSIDHSIRILF